MSTTLKLVFFFGGRPQEKNIIHRPNELIVWLKNPQTIFFGLTNCSWVAWSVASHLEMIEQICGAQSSWSQTCIMNMFRPMCYSKGSLTKQYPDRILITLHAFQHCYMVWCDPFASHQIPFWTLGEWIIPWIHRWVMDDFLMGFLMFSRISHHPRGEEKARGKEKEGTRKRGEEGCAEKDKDVAFEKLFGVNSV